MTHTSSDSFWSSFSQLFSAVLCSRPPADQSRPTTHSQSKGTAGSVFSTLTWLGWLWVYSACCGNTHTAMPYPHVQHKEPVSRRLKPLVCLPADCFFTPLPPFFLSVHLPSLRWHTTNSAHRLVEPLPSLVTTIVETGKVETTPKMTLMFFPLPRYYGLNEQGILTVLQTGCG